MMFISKKPAAGGGGGTAPNVVASLATTIPAGSSTTDVTLPVPGGGLNSGHLIVVARACDRDQAGTETTGYSQAFTIAAGNNGSTRQIIEWRQWQSGDTAVTLNQVSVGGGADQNVFIYILDDADTSTPIGAVGTVTLNADSGHNATDPARADSITTTAANSMVVAFFALDDDLEVTTPTYTSGWENLLQNTAGSTNNGTTAGIVTQEFASTGATGEATMYWSGAGDDTGGIQVEFLAA